jgi:KaiC.
LFTIPAAYAGAAASTVTTTRDLIATNSSALAASPKQESDKVVYQGNQDKRLISIIIDQLRRFETTNLVVTSSGTIPNQISSDGVSEFICDGIVSLKSLTIGEDLNRTLEVTKMRATKMDGGIKSYEINSQGISIKG